MVTVSFLKFDRRRAGEVFNFRVDIGGCRGLDTNCYGDTVTSDASKKISLREKSFVVIQNVGSDSCPYEKSRGLQNC